MGSFVGRGNQYIQLIKVLYCKLLTICKQLPTFPHKVQDLNRHSKKWEASMLPLWPKLLVCSEMQYKVSLDRTISYTSLILSLTELLPCLTNKQIV